MAEYIEREQAIKIDESYCLDNGSALGSHSGIADCIAEAISIIPAADVSTVRHGRWERTADGAALCTACKRKMNPSQYGYAFCSLCGAKMDGGNE